MNPSFGRSGESRNPFSMLMKSNMDSGLRRNDDVVGSARMKEIAQ